MCSLPFVSPQVSSNINLMGMGQKQSQSGLPTSGSTNSLAMASGTYGGLKGTPYLSKLESIASSAVRAADKVRG